MQEKVSSLNFPNTRKIDNLDRGRGSKILRRWLTFLASNKSARAIRDRWSFDHSDKYHTWRVNRVYKRKLKKGQTNEMTTHSDNDHELRYWTTASMVVQFPTTISFRIRMLYLFLPYYRLFFIVPSRVSLFVTKYIISLLGRDNARCVGDTRYAFSSSRGEWRREEKTIITSRTNKDIYIAYRKREEGKRARENQVTQIFAERSTTEIY